ncbi:MAG: ATP-binding protein [Chloroflexota bacterium]
MTFDEFTQYLTWFIYVLIFIIVVIKAIRRPLKANIDIMLLFALPALIIGINLAGSIGILRAGPITSAVSGSLIVVMGYMLFRMVDDFSMVPVWLSRAMLALAVLCVTGMFVFTPPRPLWLTTFQIVFLVGTIIYSAVAFAQQSRHSSGVTMRRMRAVAIGSVSLGALLVIAGVVLFIPGLSGLVRPVTDIAGLASAGCYFLGFATPGILRRAWQEPELRAFLGRAASLPSLPDTGSILRELERGAATSTGAPGASIGLWSSESEVLRFNVGGETLDRRLDNSLVGRCYMEQKAIFSDNIQRDSPAAATTNQVGPVAVALVVAPITAGEKRLGVLAVYAAHPPIFAEEDLDLVKLLADQAAVILESRALIDEAARVQAREEVARMKEDFLSAAAHDLKTPLTALMMQAELLERRASKLPDAPVDLAGLQKLRKEAHRLKSLVLELLDAARAEQGKLVGDLEVMDIVPYAEEFCARLDSERHTCTVVADGPTVGLYDVNRILQLLENLMENAIKYSPDGGHVRVEMWQEKQPGASSNGASNGNIHQSDWNHITVSDAGIGIPRADLPNIFERFHRGSNVDDRHFTGMGLGLFICKGIVEQHGGRLWVESPAVDARGVTRGGATRGAFRWNDGNGNSGNGKGPEETGNSVARSNNSSDVGSSGNRGSTFHILLPASSTGAAQLPTMGPASEHLWAEGAKHQ